MKWKLDENLGRSAAELFRQSGHDVQTVRTEGLSGLADQELIELCRREGRVLVTLDKEFANPLLFPPEKYLGIAVLRLPPRPTQEDLFLLCRTLIRAVESNSIVGKLWSVQRVHIREYRGEEADS